MDKKYKPIVAVVVLVILVAVLGIVSHVVMKYIPSGEKMDLNEYYGEMADGEIAIVLGTEKLDERGMVDRDTTGILRISRYFMQLHQSLPR